MKTVPCILKMTINNANVNYKMYDNKKWRWKASENLLILVNPRSVRIRIVEQKVSKVDSLEAKCAITQKWLLYVSKVENILVTLRL